MEFMLSLMPIQVKYQPTECDGAIRLDICVSQSVWCTSNLTEFFCSTATRFACKAVWGRKKGDGMCSVDFSTIQILQYGCSHDVPNAETVSRFDSFDVLCALSRCLDGRKLSVDSGCPVLPVDVV